MKKTYHSLVEAWGGFPQNPNKVKEILTDALAKAGAKNLSDKATIAKKKLGWGSSHYSALANKRWEKYRKNKKNS